MYTSTFIPKAPYSYGEMRHDHVSSILTLLNIAVGEYKVLPTSNPYVDGLLKINENDSIHDHFNRTIDITFDITWPTIKDWESDATYKYNNKSLVQSSLYQFGDNVNQFHEEDGFEYLNHSSGRSSFISIDSLYEYFGISKTIHIGEHLGETCLIVE